MSDNRQGWRSFLPSKLTGPSYSRLLSAIENTQGRLALCGSNLNEIITRIESEQSISMEARRLLVAASILNDLLEQSWNLRTKEGVIEIRPPHDRSLNGESLNDTKARLREQLLVASNRQLASESVQEFIGNMQREREFDGRRVSVESLIDDGKDLAQHLQKAKSSSRINRVLRPYTQVCAPEEYCRSTGLKLLDVWRYFRHTWALEYNPVPGRSMRILIRNAARKNHPVMGIALLASAPANLTLRDRWIGWSVDELIQKLVSGEVEAASIFNTLSAALDRSISLLRFDDLVSESEIENPDSATLTKLTHSKVMAMAARNFDLRNQESDLDEIELIDIRGLPSSMVREEDWKKLSETSLFRRKRAESLYRLLQARASLKNFGAAEAPGAVLLEMLTDSRGRRTISFLIDEIKRHHLATEVADLSVCGAVPPYGELLTGKLVALLMASREVQQSYQDRYGSQVSEISSQMAGVPVVRDSTLRILTTTSLYGVSSSQYNRLKLRPGCYRGLKDGLAWNELGKTEGFTVTHVSSKTISRMRRMSAEHYGMRRINSVFGEGSSPRTRLVREALNLLGIDHDQILKQGLTRRLYAIELQQNAREVLNERSAPMKYVQPSEKSIASAWITRWVEQRIERPDVMKRLSGLRKNSVRQQFEVRVESINKDCDQTTYEILSASDGK